MSDNGLTTRIYRELKKLNSQRMRNPMKKWASELKRQLSKEVQMSNKHEEILNIFGYKGNANQNNIEILPQSSQNTCHQEHDNKF
jgi:hypothetical protein